MKPVTEINMLAGLDFLSPLCESFFSLSDALVVSNTSWLKDIYYNLNVYLCLQMTLSHSFVFSSSGTYMKVSLEIEYTNVM